MRPSINIVSGIWSENQKNIGLIDILNCIELSGSRKKGILQQLPLEQK